MVKPFETPLQDVKLTEMTIRDRSEYKEIPSRIWSEEDWQKSVTDGSSEVTSDICQFAESLKHSATADFVADRVINIAKRIRSPRSPIVYFVAVFLYYIRYREMSIRIPTRVYTAIFCDFKCLRLRLLDTVRLRCWETLRDAVSATASPPYRRILCRESKCIGSRTVLQHCHC